MRIGVYPGTFDPVTNGHIDIIKRGSLLFDKLYVVIPNNIQKHCLFSVSERMELLKKVISDIPNVEVTTTDLLTVDYAKSVNATAMLRGLRMVSDFEYELQMATLNRCLNHDIETVFIMSSHQYSFLASSMVKEIVAFHGDISGFVSPVVEEALRKKYQN